MGLKLVGVVLLALAMLLGIPYRRWVQYEAAGLAPYGGGWWKDVAAFGLAKIGSLRRVLTQAEISGESLEGWHDDLEFNQFGAKMKMKDSPHFTENFYFWGNLPGDTSFVYTIRLSFYGVNASHVVPWFHFYLDGQSWNLPDDFEDLVSPHQTGDPMEASCKHGTLRFVCEEPMKRWKLTYSGVVKNVESLQERQVEATFVLHFNPYNAFMYQIHWDEMTAARSMAGKTWTESFWRNLRAQNQERYASQADKVEGTIKFHEEKERKLVLDGSRDHNFGIRNWNFIWRYIWWPPVKFLEPIQIDGKTYTYFTGAFTEYGNTMQNMVVGGLMTDVGDCASFSGATPMTEIAPEWFSIESQPYGLIGDKTLPKDFKFQIGILKAEYVLDITLERGRKAGLWQHSFILSKGEFEIHEAMTKFHFTLRKQGSKEILQTSTAVGLFEFGATLSKTPSFLLP